jgi:bifunctional DNA-binding transcriptional regulator/antitoxin component of YhaV-PrlF toxin-antitoxin module
MQLALNGISPSSTMDTVSINNNPVKIKKETIKTSTYGLVMPKTFKTNLGLDEFDDLEDIKHDPMFFVKKLAKKFGTHVESYELEDGTVINNFHLELKKSNGNHIYIREGLVGSDLSREIEWFKRTDELGNVYRVNGDNEIMYQMHSADDKIYIDDEGNEIIVTSGDKVIWTDENNNELDISSIEPV